MWERDILRIGRAAPVGEREECHRSATHKRPSPEAEGFEFRLKSVIVYLPVD